MTNKKREGPHPTAENATMDLPPDPDDSEETEEEKSVTRLLLDFLGWRRERHLAPPPVTSEDIAEAHRMLTDPTEEELESGRRAVERARQRREARGGESSEK